MCIGSLSISSCIPSVLSPSCILTPALDCVAGLTERILSPEIRTMMFTAMSIISLVAGVFAYFMSGALMAVPFVACSGLSYLCRHLVSQHAIVERRHAEVLESSRESRRLSDGLRREVEETLSVVETTRRENQNLQSQLTRGIAVAAEQGVAHQQQLSELTAQIDELVSQRSLLTTQLEETRALYQQICQEHEKLKRLNADLMSRGAELERTSLLLKEQFAVNENTVRIAESSNTEYERLISREEEGMAELKLLRQDIGAKIALLQTLLLQAANVGLLVRDLQETQQRV